ncbi:MAG: hypothetical protein ONB17_07020 [candidate division KSB1 bacterium]|nr:hypothetical protein [candidate division KSB1 bacterium]MDZ7294120.1 hypothetical protein [candidate division KSB1 bacterium]MDZ7386855.1 hypothetical protein [candidate division KSB1 bacterium]MDZ7393188.1 hypothetical protein [candidate division KSB1 bacterium]MDZ7412761.1 hypothetical protein [candidate division KSB1 bacterium]
MHAQQHPSQGSSLTGLIRKICAGTYSSAELVQFVNLLQKAALSYLRYQELSGKRIALVRQDREELEDLAMDCVAELFMRDEQGAFVQLRKYFGQKLEEIGDNDAEMMLQVRRLVVKKTKQELSRIFRERDPEGAKVVRNIKVAVRNAKDLTSFREMGREFICFAPNGHSGQARDALYPHCPPLRRTCPPCPEEMLCLQFNGVNHPRDSVSASIRKLLALVDADPGYQNYLSVDVVARIIRTVRNEMFRDNVGGERHTSTPLEHVQLEEIRLAKERAIRHIRQKLHATYLEGGKLGEEKAAIYCDALVDVLDDMVEERRPDSYFRLLKDRMPTLTQKQYRQQERTVFEYLAKVAKKEFRQQLRALL